MRVFFLSMILASIGCAGVTQKGDKLAEAGDYDGAIAAYDESTAKERTSDQHREISRAREKAYAQKIRRELEAVVSGAKSPTTKRTEIATLYSLAFAEANSEPLLKELEEASIDVSADELQSIHSQIENNRLEDALNAMTALHAELIPSEASIRESSWVRAHVAIALDEMAKNEATNSVKILLGALAANQRNLDSPIAEYTTPPFTTQDQVCGAQIPAFNSGPKASVNLNCDTQFSYSESSENYIYNVIKQREVEYQECKVVQTGYDTKSSSKWVGSTRYQISENRVKVFDKYATTTTKTPTYGRVCQTKLGIQQYSEEQTGTRTFRQRRTTTQITGSVTVEGVGQFPIQVTVDNESRENPASRTSTEMSFELNEQEEAELIRPQVLEKLRDQISSKIRQFRREAALATAESELQQNNIILAREYFGRAVLYGAGLPPEMSNIGFPVEQNLAWLEPFEFPIREIEQIIINRSYGFAADRFEAGFETLRWSFTAKHIRMDDLSVQPERRGYALELKQSLGLFSDVLLETDPYGWVFLDEMGYSLAAGARTSEAFQYVAPGPGEKEEDAFYYAAGAFMQFLVGYRSDSFGLLAGLRPRAVMNWVGDANGASAGLPFAARLELRPSPTHPIVLEAWGFSPVMDQDAFGGEVRVAVSGLLNLIAGAQSLRPSTRVGGLGEDDIIDLNRRPTYTFTFGIELAGFYGE